MPASAPAPTLDDLCAAMARFLTRLKRADLATLADLHDRVSAPKSRSHCVAYLIQSEIDRKAARLRANANERRGEEPTR
jgi:hypothetical protein